MVLLKWGLSIGHNFPSENMCAHSITAMTKVGKERFVPRQGPNPATRNRQQNKDDTQTCPTNWKHHHKAEHKESQNMRAEATTPATGNPPPANSRNKSTQPTHPSWQDYAGLLARRMILKYNFQTRGTILNQKHASAIVY